jgi:hypothetical protein
MVDGREKTPLYGVYESAIGELGLSVMKTVLPNSVRFRKEMSAEHGTIFRSTVFPADKSLLKGSGIEEAVHASLPRRQPDAWQFLRKTPRRP